MAFIKDLSDKLKANSIPDNAQPMSSYMQDKFPFFGIKATLRKSILRDAINSNKDEVKSNTSTLTKALYDKDEREFHYCAMELYARFKKKQYLEADLEVITYLIITHSHWDSVDFIAKHILGQFLMEQPQLKIETITDYSSSSNFWLNRAAILFQLGYKSKTDAELLFKLCNTHSDSEEFFIRKAIGWALREYSKINPEAVLNFVNSTNLKPLSRREALRLIT